MRTPLRFLPLPVLLVLALSLAAVSACGEKKEAGNGTGDQKNVSHEAPADTVPEFPAEGRPSESPPSPLPPAAANGHPAAPKNGHPAAPDSGPRAPASIAPPAYDVVAVRRLLVHGQEIPRVRLPVGIVAFPSKPESEIGRRKSVCAALMGALTTKAEAPPGAHDFMVTYWPAAQEGAWDCDKLARSYDLGAAQQAIREARPCPPGRGNCGRLDPHDRGPYLIAWTSGEMRGLADALVVNLSSIENEEDLQSFCRLWAREMETRPELWSEGRFHKELIVSIFRDFLDEYGPVILSFPLSPS